MARTSVQPRFANAITPVRQRRTLSQFARTTAQVGTCLHWQRWQGSVAGFYYQRVTAPVQFWVACGRPAGFAPRIPWWQSFVFRYLVITGWLRPSRPRPPWVE